MSYDPDKHHRRSIRLKNFDYASPGAYFITICAYRRRCLFGEIIDGEMHLNKLGHVVRDCWRAIPDHFSHVELDEWVVMPNHMHGIVIIVDDRGGIGISGGGMANPSPHGREICKPIEGSQTTINGSIKKAATK
ncbi:MAG: hypothetical protein ACFBSF_08650, partial [Leptolyngbyaceae cyanobacterium]